MIAKLIAWGTDRLEALDRLRRALEATDVDGVRTNARFLWEILGDEAVRAGDLSTRLLERRLAPSGAGEAERTAAWAIAAAGGRQPRARRAGTPRGAATAGSG